MIGPYRHTFVYFPASNTDPTWRRASPGVIPVRATKVRMNDRAYSKPCPLLATP